MARNETGYIKYIIDSEKEKIKAYIEKLKRSPGMQLLLLLLMYVGIRSCEARTLKRENFNEDYSVVRYVLKKRKMTVIKERAIPEFLRSRIKKHINAWSRRIQGGYVCFANAKNKPNRPYTEASLRDRFKRMRRDLNIMDVYYTCTDGKKLHRLSAHTLRHYAIWKIYKASGNCLITARDIIGHKKLETTARYCRSLDALHNEEKIINKAWA